MAQLRNSQLDDSAGTPALLALNSAVQEYFETRLKAIDREQTSRSDASFRQDLSAIERRACEIVDRIRSYEQDTIWTPEVEEALAQTRQETIFPGMMFMFAKERIERTRLWNIVQHMPKGCLLHAHMGAMVSFDFLIAELLSTPGMHMSSDQRLDSQEGRDNAGLEFRYKAKERRNESIWKSSYKPGDFVLLSKVVEEYPDGGREGFLKWLQRRCTLSPEDSHEQHHGINAIWQKLGKCFKATGTIICYEPILRAFLRHMMAQLKADGVNWAELRLTWGLDYYREYQEEPESDYVYFFEILNEEIARFRMSPEGRGFWGLTTIWSSMRHLPTESLVEDMNHCISTKKLFPHLIAGYDVVGPEDLGRSLADLAPELLWFRDQCTQAGVVLPFFFHAGETLGDGSDTDSNLFDAILLGTRRLGHGFSLYKHPLLIEMAKTQQILIESCPISNEVLRLCGSISAHTLPALLARGVPCCISNDDPAFLGQNTTGLSHDFWQALQGWDNLGLAGLGSLAENSIRWAVFEDQEQVKWLRDIEDGKSGHGVKAERIRAWREDWERFCQWIVVEFGDDFEQ